MREGEVFPPIKDAFLSCCELIRNAEELAKDLGPDHEKTREAFDCANFKKQHVLDLIECVCEAYEKVNYTNPYNYRKYMAE